MVRAEGGEGGAAAFFVVAAKEFICDGGSVGADDGVWPMLSGHCRCRSLLGTAMVKKCAVVVVVLYSCFI